jgi:hypothetical protein
MCSSPSPPQTNTQPEQKPLRILLGRDRFDKMGGGGGSPAVNAGVLLSRNFRSTANGPLQSTVPPSGAGLNISP